MKEYTKVENKFLDWISGQAWLTSLDIRILILMVRKTIGWNKEWDKLSFRKIQPVVKSSRQAIQDSLERLEKHNVIKAKRPGRGKMNSYKVVKCSCISGQVELTRSGQVELTNKRNKETKQKEFKQIFRNGIPIYQEI